MNQMWTLRGSERGLMSLKQGGFRVAYQLEAFYFVFFFFSFFFFFFFFSFLDYKRVKLQRIDNIINI